MLAIPRGVIYHHLCDDFKRLFSCWTAQLDDIKAVKEFEGEFARLLGRKHCVAFPFARTAIYFILKAKNLPSGAEVIMPPITIKAILDVVLDLKLKPVFVDIDPETLSFDPDNLRRAITNNTRVIILTYLFGIVPNIEELLEVCGARDLSVIEDFSQCLNGFYKERKAGAFGDVGVYSASSIKTLDTYGGGLAVCDDDSIAENLRLSVATLLAPDRYALFKKILTDFIRNLATSRLVFTLFTLPAIKLLNRVRPNSVMKQTGERSSLMISELPEEWFHRYSSFQARVGLDALRTLEEVDFKRIANVERIKHGAKGLRVPKGVQGGRNVYWQFLVYFDNPLRVQRTLHSVKIDTASTSLMKISNLPAYPVQGYTPNADQLYTNSLFIPAHHNLEFDDIEAVIAAVNNL